MLERLQTDLGAGEDPEAGRVAVDLAPPPGAETPLASEAGAAPEAAEPARNGDVSGGAPQQSDVGTAASGGEEGSGGGAHESRIAPSSITPTDAGGSGTASS